MNGKVTVDQLAQVIRTVDGGHSLGAAALAEAILEALPNLQPGFDQKLEEMLASLPAAWMTDDGRFVAHPSDATGEYCIPLYKRIQPAKPEAVRLRAHAPAQAVDLRQQQDAARWRAIEPLLSVEWDEDEKLKRWTWIDFKGDAPAIPSPTRQEYASVDEAVDALISQHDAAPVVE